MTGSTARLTRSGDEGPVDIIYESPTTRIYRQGDAGCGGLGRGDGFVVQGWDRRFLTDKERRFGTTRLLRGLRLRGD